MPCLRSRSRRPPSQHSPAQRVPAHFSRAKTMATRPRCGFCSMPWSAACSNSRRSWRNGLRARPGIERDRSHHVTRLIPALVCLSKWEADGCRRMGPQGWKAMREPWRRPFGWGQPDRLSARFDTHQRKEWISLESGRPLPMPHLDGPYDPAPAALPPVDRPPWEQQNHPGPRPDALMDRMPTLYGIHQVMLLPAAQSSARFDGHLRKQLKQLAVEGQQRAIQLLSENHEFGVVAGASIAMSKRKTVGAIH